MYVYTDHEPEELPAVNRIRALCDPSAEAMNDYDRVNDFINWGNRLASDYEALHNLARKLIEDVKDRSNGESLYCPNMIALELALNSRNSKGTY